MVAACGFTDHHATMRAHNDMAPADDWLEQVRGEQLAQAADVLRHLADPTRLHLLWLLAREPQDVNSLTSRVDASRSSVSQHLGRLRLAGLVRAERDGRRMLYSLTSDHLERLIAEAHHFADHLVRGVPHHIRREEVGSPTRQPGR
jgi:DNA-binding transcriptional ArsR family regulator